MKYERLLVDAEASFSQQSYPFCRQLHCPFIMLRVLTSTVTRRATATVFGQHCVARSFATKYAKSHEYIKMDGDVGTIGITGK